MLDRGLEFMISQVDDPQVIADILVYCLESDRPYKQMLDEIDKLIQEIKNESKG